MTLQVSKDVENYINAAVQSGRYASADEMIARLVQEDARRIRQAVNSPPAQQGEVTPDPLLGIWQDYAEEMDEIVADAYRHRREDKWRELDL
jgi:Arc/MetJ-type ribon-helix-helix transcriptional regulator